MYNSNESRYYQSFNEQIINYKVDFCSYTNSQLTALFWQIGKQIDTLLDHNNKHSNILIFKICDILESNLVLNYGNYFKSIELFKMVQLFNKFPNKNDIISIASFINWEYIKMITQAKDEQAISELIDLIINNDLNSIQFIANLSKNKNLQIDISLSPIAPINSNNPVYISKLDSILGKFTWQSVNKRLFYLQNEDEYFNTSSISKLLDSGKVKYKQFDSLIFNQDIDNVLYNISNEIKTFVTFQNFWLNSNLNIAAIKLGNYISLLSIEENAELMKYVKKRFCSSNRYCQTRIKYYFDNMVLFSRSNQNMKTIFSKLLTFDHIILLIKIKDVKELNFHFNNVIKNNLNTRRLKLEIANSNFFDCNLDFNLHIDFNSSEITYSEKINTRNSCINSNVTNDIGNYENLIQFDIYKNGLFKLFFCNKLIMT